MPTAAFATLGCKVNQYETQRILEDFEARGFRITEFNEPADIYVINTCSVTQAAERKSRYMARRLANRNPDALIVLTGCYGEMAALRGEEVSEAHLVVPNSCKLDTLQKVMSAFPHLEEALQRDQRPARGAWHARNRATLKVQDGCNVFCTFCSIPFTRRVMASRPMAELLQEAVRRAEEGYRELVITGVLVGAYGQDDSASGGKPYRWEHTREYMRPDLADLLLQLADVPGIERVRLSSIEPTQVTDRLLDAFASEPRLCPHLHIPLQSGDNRVLQRMNRPYTREFYLDRCIAARERIRDVALTADIMTGFPGEDAAAFENTLRMVEEAGYARAHLFRYSPRPNTPAADYADQVPEAEKEARSRILAEACLAAQKRFVARYLGRTMHVLVEGKEQAHPENEEDARGGNEGNQQVAMHIEEPARLLSGYTANYIRVQFAGGTHLVGKIVPVQLLEAVADGALGEAGGAHFGPDEAPPDAQFISLAAFAGKM